jgi:hypothetical protein
LSYHSARVENLLFLLQDGTLTIPAIDFAGLRAKINVPRPLDILVEVTKMEEEKRGWYGIPRVDLNAFHCLRRVLTRGRVVSMQGYESNRRI